MHCVRCGEGLVAEAKVCRACGTVVRSQQPAGGASRSDPAPSTTPSWQGPAGSGDPPSGSPVPGASRLASPGWPVPTEEAPSVRAWPTAGASQLPPSQSPLVHPRPIPSSARSQPTPIGSTLGPMCPQEVAAPDAPPAVWVVVVALGAVGVLTVVFCLVALVGSLSLFGQGSVGVALGAWSLLLLCIPLGLGMGCSYVAWRLRAGDRVARIAAVMVTLALSAALLLASEGRVLAILLGLVSAGLAAALMFEPRARAYFTGPGAAQEREPEAVVAARFLMVYVASGTFLVGLAFAAFSFVETIFLLYGSVNMGIAVGVFWTSRRLAQGDASARVYTTGLAVVYAIFGLASGQGSIGVLLPGLLSAAVVSLLWVPRASALYFTQLDGGSPVMVAAVDRALSRAVTAVSAGLNPPDDTKELS